MTAAKKLSLQDSVLLTKELSGKELSQFLVDGKTRHVCQEDGFLFEEEKQITNRLVSASDIDWENPINNLFNGSKTEQIIFEITKDLNKPDLLSKAENFLIVNKVKQTLLQDICLAMEETVSNVLMHAAPHIQSKRLGRLQIAIDPINVKAGFVCQDFAGKMNVDKMASKINKCYEDGVSNSISMTTQGAGIGSFLVFDGASSYFLFNKTNISSFVGASYAMMADKKRLAFTKHFHIGNE